MMNHFMLDCETLGFGTHPAILSIGAVQFNPYTGTIVHRKEINFDFSEACRWRKINPETVKWWLRQDKAAIDALLEKETVSVVDGLTELSEFMQDCSRVWTNGPSQDGIWVETLYENYGLTPPWRYNQHRDVRTVLDLAGGYLDVEFTGTPHCAVDDAEYQAKLVAAAYEELGLDYEG
jgi:hypothetical protein